MVKKTKKSKAGLPSKIVAFFLVLTIAAIIMILHFALAKATIKIQSSSEVKNYSGLVELLPENSLEATTENVLGKIMVQELDLTVSVPTEPEMVASSKAGGYVTIINNYSKNQPLVKTTRLLTADNKLYRLSAGVNIPAGGQVEVWAEADQEGEQYVIGETKLTIPGLWEGLQDKIYAETKGFALSSAPKYKVTQNSLNQAQEKLKAEALSQSLKKFNELLSENLQINADQIFTNFETIKSSALGEETAEATLQQKVKVYGLVFSPEDLREITKNKFQAELNSNEKINNFIDDNFKYQILEIYPDKEQAVIEVKLDANVSSSQHLLKIDKNELIGKTEAEVKNYLAQFNIEGSEIKFWPFWIKSVPKLKDHIIIE